MKLILDLDSLVERARLLIFALMSLMDHTFCHTRSMILFSFPFLVLSSLRPDDRSSEHTFYFSAYLLVSRCASRGPHPAKGLLPLGTPLHSNFEKPWSQSVTAKRRGLDTWVRSGCLPAVSALCRSNESRCQRFCLTDRRDALFGQAVRGTERRYILLLG